MVNQHNIKHARKHTGYFEPENPPGLIGYDHSGRAYFKHELREGLRAPKTGIRFPSQQHVIEPRPIQHTDQTVDAQKVLDTEWHYIGHYILGKLYDREKVRLRRPHFAKRLEEKTAQYKADLESYYVASHMVTGDTSAERHSKAFAVIGELEEAGMKWANHKTLELLEAAEQTARREKQHHRVAKSDHSQHSR